LFVEQPSSQVNVPGGAVGVLDHVGGLVVEIVSGSSAVALALVLGDRFCIPALTAPQPEVIIHRMMTSSRDELMSGGAEPAVSIKNLRVIRGKHPALRDFSVDIARGSITGLLGPSGCGKTTLMRCIVGTQIVTSGTVTVLGHPGGSASLRRRIGYLPQDPTIYNDLRIVDNVRYFASLYGFDSSAADTAVERVGLSDHRTDFCRDLSGGQRTRASLACALVCQPDLLVLDEPTVGLDPVLRVDLWEQFTDLARGGTTLLVSSHVMDEADHCGDLLLMRDGSLVAHATPTQLREDTGCMSLEDAFLSIIKHSTTLQAG
jgi:ABC-2 type transport system ATP-binding protein